MGSGKCVKRRPDAGSYLNTDRGRGVRTPLSRIKTRDRLTAMMAVIILSLLVVLPGCSSESAGQDGNGTERAIAMKQISASNKDTVTIVIGAYSVVKDALGRILPQFAADWEAKTGKKVVFQESYEASGTQARAIAGGMEADVALLAMEGDVDKLERAKLINSDWKQQDAYQGMVTRSVAVIGTRKGNPLGIRDWTDLTREGVNVLYPNPKTSGGAQWDINAIYGAGLKMAAEQGKDGPPFAKQLLMRVHHNVLSMDKSGRASMAAFEYGVGDAIVTYENEILSRKREGVPYEMVLPKHTILIENPVVVVRKYARKHQVEEAAEALVAYLREPKAQRMFAEAGFRPVNEQVAKETIKAYPVPDGLFRIEDMGGWDEVREKLYSNQGVWYQVLAGIE